MAVEVESTSQVEEFLGVLRRRFWWILVPAAVLFAIGTAFAIIVPKKYVTKTRVMVRSSMAGLAAPGGDSASTREAQVAEHQILSTTRISSVLEALRWPEYLELNRSEQFEYLKSIQERVEVEIPNMRRNANQQVVNIEFSHTDPERAFPVLARTA